MKLKICGMKYNDNMIQVAALQPDYLGFIFHEKSSRFFNGDILEVSESIKKVGVFVNAPIDFVLEKVQTYNLQAIQLHGKETPNYCKRLKIQLSSFKQNSINTQNEIIKVFSVKDTFDFSILEPYEDICDYFLFDTKGKLPGGNGYAFNWDILKAYSSTKPFFLSGGIGLETIEDIKSFLKTDAAKYCYALDVNSKFEIKPGLKNIDTLKTFKTQLTLCT